MGYTPPDERLPVDAYTEQADALESALRARSRSDYWTDEHRAACNEVARLLADLTFALSKLE